MQVDRPQEEAAERAARVRDRFVRAAQDLYRACEDAARQNDLLAVNRRPPSAFDHRSIAKRWRALADQALAAAHAWTDNPGLASALVCPTCSKPLPWQVLLAVGSSPTSAVRCPACGTVGCIVVAPVDAAGAPRPPIGAAGAVEEQVGLVDALDDIVASRLFTVGLCLNSVLPLTDGVGRSRLKQAIRDVDECIHEVRRAALGLLDSRDRGV